MRKEIAGIRIPDTEICKQAEDYLADAAGIKVKAFFPDNPKNFEVSVNLACVLRP